MMESKIIEVDGIKITADITPSAKCPFCGAYLSEYAKIKEHVQGCFENPKLRACGSCQEYQDMLEKMKPHPAFDMKQYKHEACPSGIARIEGHGHIERSLLTFQCPSWRIRYDRKRSGGLKCL